MHHKSLTRSPDHVAINGLIFMARALAALARIQLRVGLQTRAADSAIDDFAGGLTDLIDTLVAASTHGIDDEQDERRFDDPRADAPEEPVVRETIAEPITDAKRLAREGSEPLRAATGHDASDEAATDTGGEK